jgi:hypothetical protein
MQQGSFVQVVCRPAPDVQVGEKTVKGVLIAPEDVAFLRSLDDSVVIVSLECPGRKTLHARLQPLIKRMVPSPYSDDWYVSVTGTGPLYENGK